MASTGDEQERLPREVRAAAVLLAEKSVEYGVQHGEPFPITGRTEALFPEEDRATFVTLHLDGELNGCVGRLEPTRPLPHDVSHNAFRAALQDRRFDPIRPEQLASVDVHISVLNPLEPLPVDRQEEVWEYVDPGRHGLLLQTDQTQGTFLPSVWDKCGDPEQFLTHLKRKADLDPHAWPDDLSVFRYTVDEFDRETLGDI